MTNLVKAQSAIIENLSNQVSAAVKGKGKEKEFKQIFDKFANHTKQIHNVTKKLNKTVSHVNELAAVWSETTIKFNKAVKSLEEKTAESQDDLEDLEKKLTEKIDKLEQENGLRGNSASWQMAAAHVDLDATRGISSHSICTRHIHSLSTRPNLEAVRLVAMVATVDNTAISLAPSL